MAWYPKRGLLHLEIGYWPRPPEAVAPVVRKTDAAADPASESEVWLGELVARHQLKQAPAAVGERFAVVFEEAPSRVCGSAHRPVFDRDRDLYYCATCYTPMTKKLVVVGKEDANK